MVRSLEIRATRSLEIFDVSLEVFWLVESGSYTSNGPDVHSGLRASGESAYLLDIKMPWKRDSFGEEAEHFRFISYWKLTSKVTYSSLGPLMKFTLTPWGYC